MTGIPIQREPLGRRALRAWFDPRGRGVGLIGFAFNRISGLALFVYLFLHLMVLSSLTMGVGAWESFLKVARSPLFLGLDAALMAAVLYHGLNGVRATLVGLGLLTSTHKVMFWIVIVASALLWVGAVYLMLFVF
jgi:succinate dehydrogenase / fumarate reductase cytochrome b subunit